MSAMARDVLSPEIEMWCEVCDQDLVSVADLSSGEFFDVFGCNLSRWEKGKGREIGEMKQVLFAVCRNCLEKNQQYYVASLKATIPEWMKQGCIFLDPDENKCVVLGDDVWIDGDKHFIGALVYAWSCKGQWVLGDLRSHDQEWFDKCLYL
jgi:hypothetical protein